MRTVLTSPSGIDPQHHSYQTMVSRALIYITQACAAHCACAALRRRSDGFTAAPSCMEDTEKRAKIGAKQRVIRQAPSAGGSGFVPNGAAIEQAPRADGRSGASFDQTKSLKGGRPFAGVWARETHCRSLRTAGTCWLEIRTLPRGCRWPFENAHGPRTLFFRNIAVTVVTEIDVDFRQRRQRVPAYHVRVNAADFCGNRE